MKRKNILILLCVSIFVFQSCLNQLQEVTNKNQPKPDALTSEKALQLLATGGVYVNGFGAGGIGVLPGIYPSLNDGLGEGFQLIVYGMHEAMGDNIYVPWGNHNFKFLNNPTDIKLDDGTVVPMPIGVSQPVELRLRNDRAFGPSNPVLVEWTQMYFLNNICNQLLENVDKASFIGDTDTKKKTIKAWAYWWKGYAYSRIGSMYIAGLILDEPYKTNGEYVTNQAILDEATKNFDKAITALSAISSVGDYTTLLGAIIPGYCQTGAGGIPSPDAWKRNISTMKARNLLVNKRVKDMAAADWASVLNFTNSGVKKSDPVFVIKTIGNPTQSVIDPFFGAVGPFTATNDPTYFVSERLIQDFRPGDNRLANNFSLLETPQVNRRSRGLGFGTRYYLVDGGSGVGNAITYVHTSVFGADDHYMAGSYEENELMKAEATIQQGNISGGVAIIDAIRAYQGANLGAINPSSTKAEALEELRRERRIALLFRSLAFYDARRNGVIDDKSKGGGRAGSVVMSKDAAGNTIVNTNAFINYNYLSYFDVPKNELEFNTPSSTSAVVRGPN
jgi:starch-binding outer membrane protein, SusD/RagB family